MIRLCFFVAAVVQLATATEKFSCEGRASGYYADVDTGCQVYHMCDGLGRQFSYSCPNTTLFQQRMLICDHWYMVNCSKSEHDYSANLLIGQRDKPFVEDSSDHPYHRTPRPDLQQQPYAPRYQDDAYRQGKSQSLPSTLNLVGVATDEQDENGNPKRNYTTDNPQYFVPSHWSTQYGKGLTTPLPLKTVKCSKSNFGNVGKSPVGERKLPPSNFNYDPKYYKAPKITISPPIPSLLPARKDNANKKFSISRADTGFVADNVNEASVSPSTLALPPFAPRTETPLTTTFKPKEYSVKNIPEVPQPSIYYEPPKFASSIDTESTTMDPQTFYKLVPSKVLLPPILKSKKTNVISSTVSSVSLPPTTTTQRTLNKKDITENVSTSSEKRWKELRQMFFIPEYDFPLEAGPRPSYESGLSSFQVNSAPPNPEIRPKEKSPASSGPNPDCPKCDPAFLAPGTCKPCVMIRR